MDNVTLACSLFHLSFPELLVFPILQESQEEHIPTDSNKENTAVNTNVETTAESIKTSATEKIKALASAKVGTPTKPKNFVGPKVRNTVCWNEVYLVVLHHSCTSSSDGYL